MGYALQTLWYERQRFLPGVLAVAFSGVLIALQCGLLLGLFAITSIPIDHTTAHLWVGSREVLSVDLGRPVPEKLLSRVASIPGVDKLEFYNQAFANWTKPDGGSDLCMVIGSKLDPDAIGALQELTPELRERLTEPFGVVIDKSELGRLGVKGVGDVAEINKQKVRVVGLVEGMKSMAGPYILCSLDTSRKLISIVLPKDHSTYLLARCSDPADAPRIVAELDQMYPNDMSVFTSHQFSVRSRLHWLMKTKAGVALGYAALLGLLVGMVVTSQTLYAATTASAREYAILLALGIPRWRVSWAVLTQSFWVGLLGVVVSFPAVFGLGELANLGGIKVRLPIELLAATVVITLTMAMISGLVALRSVRQIEPNTLLR